MGGRGTFASGKNIAYSFKTVCKIGGVKVLKGLHGKHGLPEEAHSSEAYISLYPNGSFKQMRIYNKDLTARIDIEHSIHQGQLSLHAHDYTDGARQPVRPLTDGEIALYEKFYGGRL